MDVKSQNNINTEGMDSGDIVVSSIRPGMKREFAMMMKAQSEMGGLLSGRRRMTRSQNVGSSSKVDVPCNGKANKKARKSGSQETKKDEEKLGGGGMGRLEADVLDEDKEAKRVAAPEQPNFGDNLGNLGAELVALQRTKIEKVRDDSCAGAVHHTCTETSLPEVCDKDVTQVDNISCRRVEVSTVSGGAGTLASSPSKLELKMSKKVELKRVPTKLKHLLETGMLEGLHVRYRGSKKPQESGLRGVIRGTGILCYCCECEGSKVVTPNQFELHAQSSNKRPPEYIYLENGKSLREVLNACKVDHLDSLQSVIQNAIGRTGYMNVFCLSCKGLIPEDGEGRAMLLCNSCVLPKGPDYCENQITVAPPRSPLSDLPSPVPSSCQPAVHESEETFSSSLSQVKRQGKLTRKDLRMHKSVLAEDMLPDGAALTYVMHGEIRLHGYKKEGGIYCMCCKEVVSPSVFEAHAGYASRRKPYMSIYTSNGVSLHQLSLEISKNRKSSPDESDDLCSICKDGGELLCCDNCPRAFHIECVGLSKIPEGTWYCRYCHTMFEKEKCAENDANAIAAGRVRGVDPIAEISQRCIRIIGTSQTEVGGCAICRCHDFSKSIFDDRTVIICDQCEREYHVGCLRDQKIDDLKALPEGEWFCSRQCNHIKSALRRLTGDGEKELPESVLNIVKMKFEAQGLQQDPELDIKWRVLRGGEALDYSRMWLSGAVSIFHDRFDAINDASGTDLIPELVYGRTYKDSDYSGMYCAVLMVNSVVVTAGIFRIYGEQVAELPLVATKNDCQGKGYFQALFVCIENILSSLKVKDLVLPAAHDAESMWMNKFGFVKLEQEQLNIYRRWYQMMIFEGTSVLHKTIS